MPQALKAAWEVRAGVLPGIPIPEFTKQFIYTSDDNEADNAANPGGKDPSYHSKLAKVRAEAMDYYLQVSLPNLNNWATITFLWY